MFHWKVMVMFAVLCGSAVSHADSKSVSAGTQPSRDGWPATRAGELGRGWVRAFASGDSAVREFSLREMSSEALAKRSMESRIESYHKLRERFGRLTLGAVVRETQSDLVVTLLDADAGRHEFTFTTQPKSPFKLVSVSFKETRAGHGFHH